MLPNCPEPFYSNCSNALRRCRGCKAGPTKKQVLHYAPIEDLGEHPATSRRNEYSRAGRKAEKRTAQRINDAIAKTAASGSKHGDGDFLILDSFRGDNKLRLTKSSISLSWQEYEKGRRQGISQWFLTVLKDQPHRFVILTEESYIQLLALIQNNSN